MKKEQEGDAGGASHHHMDGGRQPIVEINVF